MVTYITMTYLFYILKFVLFDSFTHCANTLLAASGNHLCSMSLTFFFRFHIYIRSYGIYLSV